MAKHSKEGSSKKRRHSDAAAPDAAQAQPEQPAAKAGRYQPPEGYRLVQQDCVADVSGVTAGRQELWLIQIASGQTLSALQAVGSIDVQLGAGPNAATFKDGRGQRCALLQEPPEVAHQLVALCPKAGGDAQVAPIARRMTLVVQDDGAQAADGGEEAAALQRLEASLSAIAANEAEARESQRVEQDRIAQGLEERDRREKELVRESRERAAAAAAAAAAARGGTPGRPGPSSSGRVAGGTPGRAAGGTPSGALQERVSDSSDASDEDEKPAKKAKKAKKVKKDKEDKKDKKDKKEKKEKKVKKSKKEKQSKKSRSESSDSD